MIPLLCFKILHKNVSVDMSTSRWYYFLDRKKENLFMYLAKAKVSLYFGSLRHNSAGLRFAKVFKLTNHPGLWYDKFSCYALSTIYWMGWSMAAETVGLGQPDIAWSSTFLQLEQDFFNHLVNVQWLTAPWPFIPEMFWVASKLWPITMG